jgi:beta-galactosidase
VGLFEALEDISEPIRDTFPRCMEKCDQEYGYILYSTTLEKENSLNKIRLWGANDRANIFAAGKPVVTLYDRELLTEAEVSAKLPDNTRMDILVENMGRVNFGPLMERQRKGIAECVQVNGHIHFGWEMYPLPLDNVKNLDFTKGYTEGLPAFYRFELEVDEAGDTFLELEGWGKGCVFLNGFNLGRYWEIGPQKRLYIPAPLLKNGKNEIIVFETEGKCTGKICFKDEPDIG